MRVLDVATGTGLAAQAALAIVGPSGFVTAIDVSPAMVEKARTLLAGVPNVSVSVEGGQSLPFPDASVDAVICSLDFIIIGISRKGSAGYRALAQ